LNTVENFSIANARADWVAATANLWLGYGVGVFGTVGGAASEIRSDEALGEPVPYVPDRFARAGITFAHPSRLKFTLTETYVGERAANFANDRLDGYWTTDAAITWETPDRRLLVGVTALNLLDAKYELAFNVPAPSRTIAATLKARF
jgi:outer membrane receptor protein involved in Fe transport